MDRIDLRLPLAPSVNSYWRHHVVHGHAVTYISKQGKAYRERVAEAVSMLDLSGWDTGADMELSVTVQFPDRRRRDLDNLLKALQDSLSSAGLMDDDCQIRRLEVVRGGADPEKQGVMLVTLKRAEG